MNRVGKEGAMGITSKNNIDNVINDTLTKFGVTREEILIGLKNTPPDVDWCKVYIIYTGCSAEFFVKENGEWINWSYREQ